MQIPTAKTIQARLTWLDKVGDAAQLAKQTRKELETLRIKADAGCDIRRDVDHVFAKLNSLLACHGVEYIAHRNDGRWNTSGLTYLNTGDTYTPTIIYNHRTGTINVCSWGGIVERSNGYL